MTNQMVAFSASNLPATLQARLAQFNAANVLANLGGAEELDRISIKAGRFRVKQSGMDEVVLNQLHLDCVIVKANSSVSKAYYTKSYDPSAEDQSPDCASSNGIGPDAGSKNPQSANCQSCSMNVWGSKISPRGSKIKACGDSQRIAVLPIDPSTNNFFMVDGKPKAFGMSFPGASLKAIGQYAKTLAQRGLPLEIVLTRLTFDPTTEFPKVECAFNTVLPDQAANYILDYVEQNGEQLNKLVGADIQVATNVQPQAAVQPAVQAPAAVQVNAVPTFNPVAAQQPMQAAPMPAQAPAPQPPMMQAAPQATIAAAPNGLLSALQGVMG